MKGDELLPHEGERILFCAHFEADEDNIRLLGPTQWYFLGDNEVERFDGVTFKVRWLCICEVCHLQCKAPEDAERFAAKDAEWIGPPPVIDRIQ